MDYLVEEILDRLTDLDLHPDLQPDAPHTTHQDETRHATLRLTRGRSAQTYALTFGLRARPREIYRSGGDQRPFTYAPYIPKRSADLLRDIGAQYLDAAGNAWIQFGDVLIDVRGRPRPADAPRTPRSGNLFSAGRAQVLMALLAWPHLWEAPQRDVAAAAGVSLGQAHNTLALLAEAEYDRHRVRSGRASLLDLWAAAFPAGLARRLRLATYRGDNPTEPKPARRGDTLAVSGETAVPDLLRPTTLTLYVTELDPRLAVVNRWRADGEPNIVVRRRFWRDPSETGGVSTPIGIAPWPIVYADLLASRDPRARDAALEWRSRHE